MPGPPSSTGGIAGMPLPLVIVSSTRTMSPAVCGRSSGSFARQRITRSASGAGTSARSSAIGCGASPMCAASIRCAVRSGEQRLAGEQLVRHRAERVDVGAVIDVRVAGGLLGRHVRRRADRRADLRERRGSGVGARRADRLRDAEVGDDRRAAREQHVVRLDVAVHDAALVRVRQRLRDVVQDADDFGDRERSAREPRAQRFAFDERHRVEGQPVRVARGEHRNDVRLLQRGDGADLALEALGAEPCASSGDSTFTTTFRSSRCSSATNTRLMPPPPSSRSRR